MNRRVWIKQILLAGGGLMLLPACMNEDGAVSVALKNISITAKEEALFATLTETIIPQTDTLGAKALNLHQFVLKMFDDCYSITEQEELVAGLRQLNPYAEKQTNSAFIELNDAKKLDLLRGIAKEGSEYKDLQFFLKQTRQWLIKGYSTSEYVMTKLIPYELVPGRFHGCVNINKAS